MDLNLPIAEFDKPLLEGVALALAFGVDPLVELPVAAVVSGLSVPELRAKVAESTYPAPVQVGVRKRAFRLSDIKAWTENPTPSLRRGTKAEQTGDDTGDRA